MISTEIRYYCGGRLIIGLYCPDDYAGGDDQSTMKAAMEFIQKYGTAADDDRVERASSLMMCSPNDPELFGQLLYAMYNGRDQNVGTIIAITNQNQKRAASNLELYGFEKAAFTHKMLGHNPNCITWVGDYQQNVRPLLDQFQNNQWTPQNDARQQRASAFGV